jgi:hypothetical protein
MQLATEPNPPTLKARLESVTTNIRLFLQEHCTHWAQAVACHGVSTLDRAYGDTKEMYYSNVLSCKLGSMQKERKYNTKNNFYKII